jgi:DNA invertase Pin-like site-specific DNA recombinase
MKKYFGYIRVSTTKQGEQGSSLQEQKAAIEAYAQRHDLRIAEWFEEQETAASQGRPVFGRMLRGIERKQADGVITHKIDRSARNLKDWAHIGELIDRGIEMHFAHESLDLTSRSGRLSADILAVVASDYIRNLREEIRKGFYGRLKQGLYPLKAPIGYLDQGGGKPKVIDPVKGQLVRQAFELYATGLWTLHTIRDEMHVRGLRNKRSKKLSIHGISTVLNNPFYIGIIKLRSGEVFQGVHEPIVDPAMFDIVGDILAGRTPRRGARRKHRYQQLMRCAACNSMLVPERHKGHTYYRCHLRSCYGASLRQERVDEAVFSAAKTLSFSDEEWTALDVDLAGLLDDASTVTPEARKGIQLELAAVDDRVRRMTDAYIDGMIDKEAYLVRKEELAKARAGMLARQADLENGNAGARRAAEQALELTKSLSRLTKSASDENVRQVLAHMTLNLLGHKKDVAIAWRKPFDQLLNQAAFPVGAPYRHGVRTRLVLEAIWAHAKDHAKQEQEEKRKQHEAEEEARTEYLRRLYLSKTGNDDDLDLPLAA